MGKLKKGERPPVPPEKRCLANTKLGPQCQRARSEGSDFCPSHQPGRASAWGKKGGKKQAEHWKRGREALAKWPIGAEWNGAIKFLDCMIAIELEKGQHALAIRWFAQKVKCMEMRDKTKLGGQTIIIETTPLAQVKCEEEQEKDGENIHDK